MSRRYALYLVVLGAIWGSSYLFIKVGVRDLSPATLIEIRLLCAAPVLHRVLRCARYGWAAIACRVAAGRRARRLERRGAVHADRLGRALRRLGRRRRSRTRRCRSWSRSSRSGSCRASARPACVRSASGSGSRASRSSRAYIRGRVEGRCRDAARSSSRRSRTPPRTSTPAGACRVGGPALAAVVDDGRALVVLVPFALAIAAGARARLEAGRVGRRSRAARDRGRADPLVPDDPPVRLVALGARRVHAAGVRAALRRGVPERGADLAEARGASR